MTNAEFYKDKLRELKHEVGGIGIATVDGFPALCSRTPCIECDGTKKCDDAHFVKWLLAEHIEETRNSKICKNLKTDDKIFVSNTAAGWVNMHFAGYDAENDKVLAYDAGTTSWSGSRVHVSGWTFVKLPEESTTR